MKRVDRSPATSTDRCGVCSGTRTLVVLSWGRRRLVLLLCDRCDLGAIETSELDESERKPRRPRGNVTLGEIREAAETAARWVDGVVQAEWERIPTCGLCGHKIVFERCGSAEADGVPLCHADDHSCYQRWTLYGERPGELGGVS